MDALSKYLKQERKAAGLTQQDLAKKAGVGLRFVREFEQGKKPFGWTLSNNTIEKHSAASWQVTKIAQFLFGLVSMNGSSHLNFQ